MTPAEFVAARTFVCERLHARLTPEACVARQGAGQAPVEFGWGTGRAATPGDTYCRTGTCPRGISVLVQLLVSGRARVEITVVRGPEP